MDDSKPDASNLDFEKLPEPGDRFKLSTKLGSGVGGKVYEAIDNQTGMMKWESGKLGLMGSAFLIMFMCFCIRKKSCGQGIKPNAWEWKWNQGGV